MRSVVVLLLSLLLLPPAHARGEQSGGVRSAIFFYPWYGNPRVDGAYQHWQQRGRVASGFYPARGLYSSSDPLVLRSQMAEIATAGIDQVVVSWWGRGSPEDARLPEVVRAARRAGLEVAVHLEPYPGRSPSVAARDVASLARLGVRDFYVYGAHDAPAAAWAAATSPLEGVRVFVQTHLVGFAAAGGFDGIYTYDILVHGGDKFARLCAQARAKALLCAPSVGPGYDARRAVGDTRVKPRRNGRTYDAMWTAAIRASADIVTITSYNEWHEGTQIEPARPHRTLRGEVYAGYDGAWRLRGKRAQRAYLARTALWTARFASLRR